VGEGGKNLTKFPGTAATHPTQKFLNASEPRTNSQNRTEKAPLQNCRTGASAKIPYESKIRGKYACFL